MAVPSRLCVGVWILGAVAACAWGQHDFVEDEVPCAVRCALAAASLISPDRAVPELDAETLAALREDTPDLNALFHFLRRHGYSPASTKATQLATLRPSAAAPVMLELNGDWPKRGAPEGGLSGVDYGDERNHYALAIGREGTAFLIWDVTVEIEPVPLDELEGYFSGRIVTLTPQPAWMRTVREMAAHDELRLGGGVVLLAGAVLLAFQYRRMRQARRSED